MPSMVHPAPSPGHHSPLPEMQEGVLMAFIHRGLLLLTCLLGCSQLSTTASPSGLARDGVAFPSALSRETLAAETYGDLLSSCSPPRDNPQPCRAALPALSTSPGHRRSQGRQLLSRNPRCRLWYTTHSSSISTSHCKGAETAVFHLLGDEEVHFYLPPKECLDTTSILQDNTVTYPVGNLLGFVCRLCASRTYVLFISYQNLY